MPAAPPVRPRPLVRALSLALFALPLAAQTQEVSSLAEAELRRIAGALQAFPTGDWFYGRPAMFPALPELREPTNELLAELEQLHVPTDVLRALLADADPRVRTLALAKLVAQGPPEELVHLAELEGDPATTFPRPKLLFGLSPGWEQTPAARDLEWHLGPQTVGQVARDLLAWIEREGPAPGWGWRSYQVLRATQGIAGPVEGQREVAFALAPVDELPPVQRELCFVALFERHQLGRWIDERRAFKAARRLGRERLLALLAGELELGDLDLDAHEWESPWHAATRFVLRHAAELLRREDADALSALGSPIAAAELDPARAAAFLRPALAAPRPDYSRHEEAPLVEALWRLAGEEQAGFVLDWLLARGAEERTEQDTWPLLDLLVDRYEELDRRLLARLVRDPRVNALTGAALVHLVRGWNENLLERVASEADLRRADHPGADELRADVVARLRALVESW